MWQDTPSVKATYDATITAPAELTVLMSALRKGKKEVEKGGKKSQVFKFEQKIPIPPYLIAIAAGDVVSKKIGPRSHVWSEAAVIEKAFYNFTSAIVSHLTLNIFSGRSRLLRHGRDAEGGGGAVRPLCVGHL